MSTKKSISAIRIVRCGLVAALYTVLCLVLAPISFGAMQVRISEALCLLPVFGADYIIGVTLGCLLSNMLGVAMGTTVVLDIVFGTLATLLACICTYFLRSVRTFGLTLPASIPPVIFNAVIIGLEISFLFTNGTVTAPIILFNMVTVGLGEIISCCILGVILVRLIERTPRLHAMFTEG